MVSDHTRPSLKGAALALAAAVLFGLAVPLAKQLLSAMTPPVLAGLFYLGSGCLLFLGSLCANVVKPSYGLGKGSPKGKEWFWLLGAILCGGLFAQSFEIYGISMIKASEASLLLNLESVFTVALAILFFREHAGARFISGTVLLILGAAVLTVGPDWHLGLSFGGICLVLACLGWALDNNLTRNISHANPVLIVMIKGFAAGTILVSAACIMGAKFPPVLTIGYAMLVGALGYGVSLVCFVLGMRFIGAARTGAYFCTAPFVGAVASIFLLHESLTPPVAVAAVLMGIGLYLHFTEQHEHQHTHEAIEHEHEHIHDDHHQHEHGPDDPPGEPHTHKHRHAAITHIHAHQPDIHHLHDHN